MKVVNLTDKEVEILSELLETELEGLAEAHKDPYYENVPEIALETLKSELRELKEKL